MIGTTFHFFPSLSGYSIYPFVEDRLCSVLCNAPLFHIKHPCVCGMFLSSLPYLVCLFLHQDHTVFICNMFWHQVDQVLPACSLQRVSQLLLAFFITIYVLNSADQVIHTHTQQIEFLLGLLWIYRSRWELTLLQYGVSWFAEDSM